MQQNFTDVLPFTQYDPSDEIVLYSLNGTGVGGRFVTFETGNQDPTNTAGNYVNATPGYNYSLVTNLRYENPRKVKFAASGSYKDQVLGITLYGTAEYDQNGQKLILNPYRKTELGVVYSGESVNVLTDGVVRLKATAYSGIPIPGYVAVISNAGNGLLQIYDPATLASNELSTITSTGSGPLFPQFKHVVAKVISSSGTALYGSYADFKLALK